MTADSFEHWIDLSEDDLRSMLIALIGLEFGSEPEKRIPEIREARRAFSNHIADQVALSDSDVIVDLGSGCGFGTYWLAQRAKYVNACDISPGYLSFAKRECSELENVSFHLIKSRHLDTIASHSIDVVCAMSVFIHLNLYDIYWYFKEFNRIVKPGGRIWIDFADSESLDLSAPNTNGTRFLRHAKDYDANPSQLGGLMPWNSCVAILEVAQHFGFECKDSKKDGELLLSKSVPSNEQPSRFSIILSYLKSKFLLSDTIKKLSMTP